MLVRGKLVGDDERRRERRAAAMQKPEGARGIVFDLLGPPRAVRHEHLALIGDVEDGLDAARDVPGEKGDRSGWRDRRQQPVADPVRGDAVAYVCRERRDMAAG